ncbi:MAG TPA: hypothetical protein VJZ70_01330, partial [Limnochordia bacterium]|nr:hypothetical protein [Limnochordia bacterium]
TLARDHALSVDDLSIDGHVLVEAFDLRPGPIIGDILRHLLEQVLEDPSLNHSSQLARLALEYLESLPENHK